MQRFKFNNIENRFIDGLTAFGDRYGFSVADSGIEINVSDSDSEYFSVCRNGNTVDIKIGKPVHLFRALGFLLQNIDDENYSIRQKDYFYSNGLMYDGSQASSLLNLKTCKEFLLMLAAMGLNTFMLYTENTFDLPDEPYWGYMRPRYTKEQFKELDDFAYSLGIEIIPCIQTLGHLSEAIKWAPYSDFSDTPSTLLVGDARTYELCDKIIKTMSECFRTKRIHVGLDEAWGLGKGNYLNKNGYRETIDIMCEHIEKVKKIAEKYGYSPMMWGDMFVRVYSENESAYLENTFFEFPQEIIDKLPKGIQVVYWDYYNQKEHYDKWLPEYKKLCDNLIFSGCSRNVRTFGSHHTRTVRTSTDALISCKENGVKEVFVTVWGDDHRESSPYAILPGIQIFAEHEYNENISEEEIAKRFEFCTSVPYKAITDIAYFDMIPEINGDNYDVQSPSKTLLWQNILLGLFDAGLDDHKVGEYYKNLGNTMAEYKNKYQRYSSMFEFYEKLAIALSIKGDIGKTITEAYLSKDMDTLKDVSETVLPLLEQKVEELRLMHQKDFYLLYNPIGWEILDIRYGGTIMGIRTAKHRIDEFLAGNIDRIGELEEPRLLYNGQKGLGSSMNYNRICSASNL